MNVPSVFTYNDTTYDFEIKSTIPFVDAKYIVLNVTEASFDENEKYLPFDRNVYFWYFVISRYTNLDMDEYSLATTYELMFNSDIISKVIDVVDVEQFDMIKNAIEDGIRTRINKHPLKDILADAATALNQFKDFATEFTGNDDAKAALAAVLNNLSTLNTQNDAR